MQQQVCSRPQHATSRLGPPPAARYAVQHVATCCVRLPAMLSHAYTSRDWLCLPLILGVACCCQGYEEKRQALQDRLNSLSRADAENRQFTTKLAEKETVSHGCCCLCRCCCMCAQHAGSAGAAVAAVCLPGNCLLPSCGVLHSGSCLTAMSSRCVAVSMRMCGVDAAALLLTRSGLTSSLVVELSAVYDPSAASSDPHQAPFELHVLRVLCVLHVLCVLCAPCRSWQFRCGNAACCKHRLLSWRARFRACSSWWMRCLTSGNGDDGGGGGCVVVMVAQRGL